jgi:type IV secretory pathway VirB2 component (pilin)
MLKMVFNFVAALCAVAFVLLLTGLMGLPGLCSFSRVLVWIFGLGICFVSSQRFYSPIVKLFVFFCGLL